MEIFQITKWKAVLFMNRIMVIVVVLSCTISNIIFAQSPRFMVGLTTNPTYFNNHRKYLSSVYEYYEGLNKHQFYLTNGVIIDYKLNSKFTISLKPTFFKRKFENDCVNFKQITLGGIFYIANSDNCFYTIDASYSFLQIPLMFCEIKKDPSSSIIRKEVVQKNIKKIKI